MLHYRQVAYFQKKSGGLGYDHLNRVGYMLSLKTKKTGTQQRAKIVTEEECTLFFLEVLRILYSALLMFPTFKPPAPEGRDQTPPCKH